MNTTLLKVIREVDQRVGTILVDANAEPHPGATRAPTLAKITRTRGLEDLELANHLVDAHNALLGVDPKDFVAAVRSLAVVVANLAEVEPAVRDIETTPACQRVYELLAKIRYSEPS
jgi:hypothetical protein